MLVQFDVVDRDVSAHSDRATVPFVIAGAGGYACELVVACRALNREPVCLLDDGAPDLGRIADTEVELCGTVDEAERWAASFLVGIGYPQPRAQVTGRLLAAGLAAQVAIVHPHAALLGAAPFGDGTVVFPNATVSRGVSIGGHVLINYNASVGHDTVVGEFSTISPGAQIGGECHIGRRVLVGSGAVLLQGVRIGDDAVVGSGSVVTRDVGPGQVVAGVPARTM